MKIISSAFEHNSPIPSKYTCDGENINPPLEFLDVPENTVSLALIMEDPDVPKHLRPDGMWDHWVVWNMPADVKGIEENRVARGVTGLSTSGVNAYGGPCPPDREHRYFFKLFALDIELDMLPQSTKIDLEKIMQGHIIEETQLIGTYNRN